jgi:oligopeptide transport system permease protein
MAATPVNLDAAALQVMKRKSTSLWRDAMYRLRKNKAAMLSLGVILFFTILAIFAKQIAPYSSLDVPEPSNTLRQAAWIHTDNPATTGTWKYPLGTDSIGHDVLSQVIWGARVSIVVGFIPMILIVTLGTTIGMIAGYAGGRVDNLLMRITDVVYAFPDLLFFIIVMTALRDSELGKFLNGLLLLFAALSIVNWVGVARIVRGQVLSLKEKEFVEAARMLGAGKIRIMVRHLFPNTLAPIVVVGAFLIPGAILTEAILGFLGIGLRPASDPNAVFQTSWGMLLLWGKDAMQSQPWLLIAPAFCIALIMLSFTFVGDGLRDALDPSMKGGR